MTSGTAYGYARVSARHQHEDRQKLALLKLGIARENIYVDKQSGKDFQRARYRALIARLRPNDVIYIKSIDRLGRNYREILEQWRYITKVLLADVVVLDLPLLDTRRGKDLMGAFISDVVLQILSFVAENERSNILQRQREGVAAARVRGVRFGRPKRPAPENFVDVVARWKTGALTCVAAAKECGMPISTFRAHAKRLAEKRVERDIPKSPE